MYSKNTDTHIPVGVAQGDAEVPGDSLQRGAGNIDQSYNDDKDVDRRPAYDEDSNHHQDHAGDPTQVPVLLLCVRVKDGKWFSVGDKKECKMGV